MTIQRRMLQLAGVLGFMGILSISVPAQATDTAATANMPQGVSSLANIFTIPTLSGSLQNSGKLIYSTNSQTKGQPAVQMTDAKNQVAAVWSTEDNKLDLSQNQTASMWMYFGGTATTPDNGTGDGMAFVLQNVGTDAITSGLSSTVSPGQTLGVWGLDNNKNATSSDTIASKGIQKSWAIEFDEYDNFSRTGGDNGGLDNNNGFDGSHIASAYPGDPASYGRHGTQNNSNEYYYSLKHTGITEDKLSDGQWHHITLKWTAPAVGSTIGNMTYTYNDKDPQTGMALTSKAVSTSVDITKLGLGAIDANHSSRSVYWGFTGSTGGVFANNVVAFDQVPGLVNSTADLTVTDETQNKALAATGDTVNGGDSLTYQYQLAYQGGNQNWEDITTALPKPSDVTFSKGVITYADGSTETLTASELASATIQHKLQKSLSSDLNQATVTLTGTANKVTQSTAIASANQAFNGSNQVATVTSPSYTILPARDIKLTMASDNPTSVKPDQTINLAGTAVATTGDALTNSNVTLHVGVNGSDYQTFTMNGTQANAATSGAFNFDLPASELTAGSNQVTVYATDERGNKSNVATFDITMAGELKFGTVNDESSFKTTALVGMQQLIQRNDDWKVVVDNTLGKGSNWSLRVSAGQFTDSDTGQVLDGNVLLVNGDSQQTLGSAETVVATHTATSGDEQTDVTQDWGNQSGIVLKVNGSALGGTYKGDLKWSLIDSVQ